MLFQTPTPRPYNDDLRQQVKSAVKNTQTKQDRQLCLAAHPEDYLHGPVPNAATIDSYCIKPGMLTQQQCDDFAIMRDFLLGDIGGESVVFSQNTVLPPHVTGRYALYLGSRVGGPTITLVTRPMIRNGYLNDMLNDNPIMKLFKGMLLTKNGEWDYHEAPIIAENNGVLFIENRKDTVAYFGEIYTRTECDGKIAYIPDQEV